MASVTQIYTDGSCHQATGRGGWAYFIPELNQKKNGKGTNTTSQRMELKAVIEALRYCKHNDISDIEVITDSQLIVECFYGRYKAGKNLDLWKKLYKLTKPKKVVFTWVKGHDGNVNNEIVDELASYKR